MSHGQSTMLFPGDTALILKLLWYDTPKFLHNTIFVFMCQTGY